MPLTLRNEKVGYPNTKKVIELPNREYKPLKTIGTNLKEYPRQIITSSMDEGLAAVVKSNEEWPGQRLEYRQATFVNGMLAKLYSLPGGLGPVKENLAKPAILGFEAGSRVESPAGEIFKQINKKISDSLITSKESSHTNCDIQATELSLPEITAIVAAYMETAQIETEKYKEFTNSYFTRRIETSKFNGIDVKNIMMRIRSTPSDLKGHEGGPGHIHLELAFTKSTTKQNISINIHIYPNLKPFSKTL